MWADFRCATLAVFRMGGLWFFFLPIAVYFYLSRRGIVIEQGGVEGFGGEKVSDIFRGC